MEWYEGLMAIVFYLIFFVFPYFIAPIMGITFLVWLIVKGYRGSKVTGKMADEKLKQMVMCIPFFRQLKPNLVKY